MRDAIITIFKPLFDLFDSNGEQLFFVGGFVRDLLLAEMDEDVAPKDVIPNPLGHFYYQLRRGYLDVDFATSALPEKTIQILKSANMKTIPIGLEFGTIQTFVDELKVEITTFRCAESYKKGSRKPSVSFGKTLEEDLLRRDLTINAMAMTKEGKLIDPCEGHPDLIMGLLYTPIDGKISFSDDPLRMMRACRFYARGLGQPSHEIMKDMKDVASEIKNISQERIFDEMNKLLLAPEAGKGLKFMADSGLLREAFPELQVVVDFKQNQGKWHSKLVWEHTLQVIENVPQKSELKWAALYHDVAKPQTYQETESGVHFYGHDEQGKVIWDAVANRLKVSNVFKEHVGLLIFEHLQPSLLSSEGANHPSNTALRRLAHRVGDKLDDLFDLSMADITSHKPEVVQTKTANCRALRDRIKIILEQDNVAKLKLPTGLGNVLMKELGIPAGKELGIIMKQLNQMLIDGELNLESDFVQAARNLK